MFFFGSVRFGLVEKGKEKHITYINDYRQNKMKMASENIRNNINFVYYILCIDLNRAVNPFLAITFGEQHRVSALHAHGEWKNDWRKKEMENLCFIKHHVSIYWIEWNSERNKLGKMLMWNSHERIYTHLIYFVWYFVCERKSIQIKWNEMIFVSVNTNKQLI